jgi:hypothetical protein
MAMTEFWCARDVLQARLDVQPSRRLRLELARLHNAIGASVPVDGMEGVPGPAGRGVQFARRLAAESHRQATAIAAQLVEEAPADRAARLLLARSHRLAAQVRTPATSDADVQASLRLLTELLARFPDDVGVRFEFAEAHSLFGQAATTVAAREASFAAARTAAAELVRSGVGVPEYEALAARVEHRAGEAALAAGACDQAVAALATASALRAELCQRLPQAGRYAADRLASLRAHAEALHHCGRTAEAIDRLELAVVVAESAARSMAAPFACC